MPILMLAYLMLLAALSNTACLYAYFSFLPLIFANAFCFHALSWFVVCLFEVILVGKATY